MIPRPPSTTRTDPRLPYTTLFRSGRTGASPPCGQCKAVSRRGIRPFEELPSCPLISPPIPITRSSLRSAVLRSPSTCSAMSVPALAVAATGHRVTIMSAIYAMVRTTIVELAAPMRTIAVSLLKGGVGKTFLATHLAWYLAEAAGRRVVFVDLDPQGSSSRRLAGERPGGFAADLFDPSAALAADGQVGLTLLAADQRLQMIKAAQEIGR